MTIKDRFLKCKLNLKTVAGELKTRPSDIYKILDGDATPAGNKEQAALAKKLTKRIEKEEKALGIDAQAAENAPGEVAE